MNSPIHIFTNTYPYETGETFLATEIPYILELKRPVIIIPLYGQGPSRTLPSYPGSSVIITPPLLPFSPKNKSRLLFCGIFNRAPLFFAFKDFLAQKVWKSPRKIWRFGTSLLLLRCCLSKNKALLDRMCKADSPNKIFYFYWGDKSVNMLPFLRKRFTKQHPGDPFPKTITRFHGSDLYEEAKGFIPFRNRVFPFIDLACPISEHGAAYLRQRYGAMAPPISLARLGSKDHGPGPEPAAEQPFHIVSCANMIPLKRLNLIWEALLLLCDQKRLPQPVQWTHIGEGPLRGPMEAAVQANNHPELLSARFYGQLPHDEVIKFYREIPVDLYMLTSRSEGVPVSIMEALSFGIPVMATAVGGVPELVSQENGCLLPAHPPVECVAQALLDFICLPLSNRQEKRIAARTVWEKDWDADINFRKFRTTLVDFPHCP